MQSECKFTVPRETRRKVGAQVCCCQSIMLIDFPLEDAERGRIESDFGGCLTRTRIEHIVSRKKLTIAIGRGCLGQIGLEPVCIASGRQQAAGTSTSSRDAINKCNIQVDNTCGGLEENAILHLSFSPADRPRRGHGTTPRTREKLAQSFPCIGVSSFGEQDAPQVRTCLHWEIRPAIWKASSQRLSAC